MQLKVENIATDGNCDQQLQILQPDCNWTNYTTHSCNFCNQNICSVVYYYRKDSDTDINTDDITDLIDSADNQIVYSEVRVNVAVAKPKRRPPAD